MKSINIVLPAYNEEKILENNTERVVDFCNKHLAGFNWTVVISDNGSTDKTEVVGRQLSDIYEKVNYLRTDKPGKGQGIRSGWDSAPSDFYCFMDADLATNLEALPQALGQVEQHDLVLGSRFLADSRASRTLIRWMFSYLYRFAAFIIVGCPVSDLPCGFKVINNRVWTKTRDLVESTGWFFDSELVIIAYRLGFKIKDLPVKWSDIREKNDKSKVKVFSLGLSYLGNLIKLRKRLKKYV